ncbi:MAG: cyclic nucleotide-binding domain-containing protein, partial [Bacteriovoracaceae bacterium]
MESLLKRLRYNILLEQMDDDEYQLLLKKLQRHSYRKNDIIIDAGVPGDHLYLLVKGRIKIVRRLKTGEELLLAFLHQGDFFGEMELIDGRDRSSRVIAVDDCVLFTLTKHDFSQQLKKKHAFCLRLMEVLSIRLRSLKHTFIAELERSKDKASQEFTKLKQVIEATQVVNSTLELDELLKIILETAMDLLDAERGTVYVIDEKKNELWSIIFKGPEQIKIQLHMGQGIAGYVAATGDTVNIP